MRILVLLLLFCVPLLELWILLQLVRLIPFWSVIFLCMITAAYGLWLMRIEGFSIWTLMETEIQNRRLPTEEVIDALLIWSSGALLFLPGLLTDGVGFMLVIPVIREECVKKIREWMRTYYRL